MHKKKNHTCAMHRIFLKSKAHFVSRKRTQWSLNSLYFALESVIFFSTFSGNRCTCMTAETHFSHLKSRGLLPRQEPPCFCSYGHVLARPNYVWFKIGPFNTKIKAFDSPHIYDKVDCYLNYFPFFILKVCYLSRFLKSPNSYLLFGTSLHFACNINYYFCCWTFQYRH